jgi:hypothetical protein
LDLTLLFIESTTIHPLYLWVINSQDGDEAEDSLEGTSSTMSPPPALSEDLGFDKKRKHMKELLSSSTSAHKNVAREASALEEEEELFDALDS